MFWQQLTDVSDERSAHIFKVVIKISQHSDRYQTVRRHIPEDGTLQLKHL
jgi:hypothetical protein